MWGYVRYVEQSFYYYFGNDEINNLRMPLMRFHFNDYCNGNHAIISGDYYY